MLSCTSRQTHDIDALCAIADREYQQSQQRGLSLKQIPVALEGLAIAVHPDLQIPGLTLGQIKDIYTGKITN